MLSVKEIILGIMTGANVSQWDSIVPQSLEHLERAGAWGSFSGGLWD